MHIFISNAINIADTHPSLLVRFISTGLWFRLLAFNVI